MVFQVLSNCRLCHPLHSSFKKKTRLLTSVKLKSPFWPQNGSQFMKKLPPLATSWPYSLPKSLNWKLLPFYQHAVKRIGTKPSGTTLKLWKQKGALALTNQYGSTSLQNIWRWTLLLVMGWSWGARHKSLKNPKNAYGCKWFTPIQTNKTSSNPVPIQLQRAKKTIEQK